MDCGEYRGASVFDIITRLCEKTVQECELTEDFGNFNKCLLKKVRSHAFSILLNKTSIPPPAPCDPLMDLLSDYYVKECRKTSIADYDNVASIKNKIDWLFKRDKTQDEKTFLDVLTCVVALRNSTPVDYGKSMFENPFSFGKINKILPTAIQVNEHDPKPYQYFPPHIFQLPYSISDKEGLKHDRNSLYNLPVDLFTSKPGTNLTYLNKISITNTEHSVSSTASRGNHWSPMSSVNENTMSFPRLTAPRDLNIPKDTAPKEKKKSDLKNKRLQPAPSKSNDESGNVSQEILPEKISIWDLANCCRSDVNMEIWEEASKLPPVEKQPLLSSSIMQMNSWRLVYQNQLRKFHIVSGVQFLLHIKFLVMGIESNSFPFNLNLEKFQMKDNLCLEGLLQSSLEIYVSDLLTTGTCYWKLSRLVSSSKDNAGSGGLVYKAMCDSIKQYLLWFRMEVDKIFGEGLTMEIKPDKRLPSLMEVIHQMKPLSNQIQTIAKIFKVYDSQDSGACTLKGAGLMAYLYNEISQITQTSIFGVLYAILKAICCVYIRFIQRFIFEGELEDEFEEFFIRKDFMNDGIYNKRYWDKGFTLRSNEMVPEFLREMARHILLCGKSLRLLKLCNPDDPLCVLLSTEYPPIKCCLNFSEIDEQRKLYERYRTQCLYVCGDPVTFQSILVQKETEKKAFREMVSLKQAETMEKLIEERKRLTHILSSSKQRQYNALRAAAEEAAAKKKQRKQQDLEEDRLIIAHQEANNKLHKIKIMEEKDKINAYYSDLGKEIEKRKMRTEWKIKRLQLDERRVQLLTSEKMNLKREKLEVDHRAMEESDISIDDLQNSEVPITSEKVHKDETKDYVNDDNLLKVQVIVSDVNENAERQSVYSSESQVSIYHEALDYVSSDPNLDKCSDDSPTAPQDSNANRTIKRQQSDTVEADLRLSDIINKNILLNTKPYKSLDIDVSPSDIINSNVLSSIKAVSSSDQDIFDTYQQRKKEALLNKQKVMAHEFAVDTSNITTENTIPSPNNNKHIYDVYNANVEANANRIKGIGSTIFSKEFLEQPHDPDRSEKSQYNTEASREALKNRKKILNQEFGVSRENRLKQRGSLTLDLKKCSGNVREMSSIKPPQYNRMSIGSTPDGYLTTPSEFQARLDIETPSTLDVGLFGAQSGSIFTPLSSQIDSQGSSNNKFSVNDGFPFPTIIEQQFDDEEDGETVPDYPQNEPIEQMFSNVINSDIFSVKSKVWNFSSDELNFSDFKPFGIEMTSNLKIQSMDIFTQHLCLENPKSPYTDIGVIISKSKKKPLTDIFKSICELDDELHVIQNVEILDPSMMAACLQRSIMIPLSYQMEMVNNAMLKYFLVNCELYDHLKSLCDYFFLMDGEFAKTICSKLFEKLNTTESPRELLNFATLHSILDKSFGSSVGDSVKYAENLSFIISEMPISFSHSSPDVLECLTLSYSVSWPLNILLSKDALERYAKVFQFLVKMRRISWVLEQDLEVLKLSMKEEFMVSQDLVRSPQYHSIQLYRYMMSCLIRALHGYVVNTCIKSSWTEFEKDLLQVKTLDDLYMVHVTYIKKVLFRCLLNKRSTPIMKMLNDIFSVVLRFHHLLNARCWHIAEEEVHYTHPFFPQMKELFLTFDKLAKHLHKMANRLSECGYQPHLVELATLINMNGYFNY